LKCRSRQEQEDEMTDQEQSPRTRPYWSRKSLLGFSIAAGSVAVLVALVITLGVSASEKGAPPDVAPSPAVGNSTPSAGASGSGGASATAPSQPPLHEELSRTFAAVSRDVQPAVVNVSTERRARATGIPDEFFERFFGQAPPAQTRRSLGSGVIVDPDGYVLTNHHVVEGAEEIHVQLGDLTTLDATVVGTDRATDLAVLRIEDDHPLPSASLGDSDALSVGQWVLAIGNPFGVGQTVTAGIVSATRRVIGQGPYDDFIQTDAAINPGNSGGPLVDMQGKVIGINSAIISRSGGNMGVGFAIPVSMARNVYRQIREHGSVTRGWLGVSIQNLTPELAEEFGVPGEKGALVAQVLGDGSPAAKAGLQAGDVIVSFAGEPIESGRDLSMQVASVAPGTKAEVEYSRDGTRHTAEVTVARREEQDASPAGGPEESGGRLGISGQDLTSRLAQQLGTSSTTGVVVAGVEPGGAADDAGLMRGDIIHEANHETVESLAELKSAIGKVPKGGRLLLRIERIQGGTSGFLYVPVQLD